MKRVLLPLLAISSLLTNSYGLSGGPVYPVDTSANQSGTYSAVIRGENMMGVTVFGVSGATADGSANTTTAGLSLVFFEGLTSSGYSFGIGGPATTELVCVFEASRTRQGGVNVTVSENEGTPEEATTSYFVNDAMYFSGSYEARLQKGVTFATFSGKGSMEFTEVINLNGAANVNGTLEANNPPSLKTRTIDFTVSGARTSLLTSTFSGFNTIDQPSVVELQ